MLIKS